MQRTKGVKPVTKVPPTRVPAVEVAPVVESKVKGKIAWVNHGGPFYPADGNVYKKGETFYAAVEDIPKAFRDNIRPADPISASELAVEPIPLVFKLKQRGTTSFFDIVDGTGKRINEKDLTEEQAKDILDKFGSTN